MKVKLINYTRDGERLIAQAGKLCYSPVGVDEIMEDLDDASIEKFVKMLMKLGHYSPLEHVSFTFAAEGVSRTLTHQLVRHRLASYSQQSQRYVKLDKFEYIIPPAIEENKKAKKIFLEAMEADNIAYKQITEELFAKYYNQLLEKGVSEKKAKSDAEKNAIEDARYVFPNACETKIVFTMNARTLLHFFEVRSCNRAQWEIRNMAIEMIKCVKDIYPSLFVNAGPGCTHGECPEGNMTCGKIIEVREFFKNI
ncbi:MAG: FAD-dependent thymidylate synthase [Tissierellia bacterium]|nr:FAD-dependent thymidylate synthase [Tissierellia bacterium]